MLIIKRTDTKINFSGFTLVEALVFLFIFSVVTMTFYSVLTSGMGYVSESRNKIGAIALSNEKMEIVRNLKYEDIGTTTGIPPGSILMDEDVTENAKNYHVKTIVQYIDDPLDGVLPTDTVPTDYKKVKITISWYNFKSVKKEVSLTSRFTPPGLEVVSGDGILAVNIADSTGAGIGQAHVHIVNGLVSPQVNIEQDTDDGGNLIFPGAKQSQHGYEITVSKDGYEMVSTIDPYSVPYTPNDPHASVVAGSLNTAFITIDKLSDLKIKTLDYLGNPLPNADFHIKGGRELGTDSSVVPPEIVYGLDSNETTGSDGEKDFNDSSPGGQFSITNIESISGHTLIGVNSIFGFETSPVAYNFSLLPDESKTVEIKFAVNDVDSLLIKVLNNDDDSRINEAEVRLTNAGGFDSTITTSFDGVAFFPEDSDLILPGTYDLEITSPGFQSHSSSVNIDKLTVEEIKLNPE